MIRMDRNIACCLLLVLPLASEARPPDGHGGGVSPEFAHDHMPEEARRAIELELYESARRLEAEGKLPAATLQGALTPGNLEFPLKARPGVDFDGFFGISNFVDLEESFGTVEDYQCGQRTYDLSGYNHAGVDYFLYPFQWRMMDMEMIEIVAAAPGTVLAKHDGNDDYSCDANTAADWNAVYVQHADGSVAWYGHMKQGSLTEKPVGETVVQGEYLGLVGSSGRSSGPHLHFELRASNMPGAGIHEPHAGDCNDTVESSLWAQQPPYYEPGWYGAGVHDGVPAVWECYGEEQDYLAGAIEFGGPVWFSIHFRDALPEQAPFILRLFQPGGGLYHEWQFAYPETVHYPAVWYYWNWDSLGTDPAFEGEWTFEAEWQGEVTSRAFYYGDLPLFEDRFEAQ